jgi:hypothetical protein
MVKIFFYYFQYFFVFFSFTYKNFFLRIIFSKKSSIFFVYLFDRIFMQQPVFNFKSICNGYTNFTNKDLTFLFLYKRLYHFGLVKTGTFLKIKEKNN